MSERVLRPCHLNVSYTAINSDDEAGPSNAPISSKKTKKIPKSSITKYHSAVSKQKEPPYTPAFDPASLPNAQWFEPLIHPRPLHKAYNKLPPALGNLDIIEPINIFQLFFTDDMLEAISVNTNHYAAQKRVEKGLGNMRGRAWKDTTSRDIKCWLGIVIYMRVVGLPAVRDYWSTDGLLPSHDICNYMSLTRWEDIKGYLHIASPDAATHDPTGKKLWHQKIDPLLNQVRYAAQCYRIPSSNIAIDEAIIRCTGRYSDTYKTPFKPIPQGLKFHCAADHGYIFDFHATSNKYGPDAFSESTISEHLSDTNSLILEMMSRLPNHHSFNLYMDNYYTNLPIVSLLRRKGIGACGTVRTTSKNYPSELIIPKNALSQLAYHYRAGVVKSGVATMLWIDNAPVSMMTSIHHLKGRKSEVIKERLKPGLKSTNSAGIKRAQVFTEGEWKAMLNIPTCIENYNHHMGGVDIADQYRAYYDTQIISRRT